MKHYYPKSQLMQLCAVPFWVICVLAVRQSMGLDWESGGIALAGLLGLGVAVYLTSGTAVHVDPSCGRVFVGWRLAGVAVRRRLRRVVPDRVELRPEWMWRKDLLNRILVYDLVLTGREPEADGEIEALAIDLKEDQLSFRLAERRARAVGAELGLPVAVRWERRFDDVPDEERSNGALSQPFVFPAALRDWKRWV